MGGGFRVFRSGEMDEGNEQNRKEEANFLHGLNDTVEKRVAGFKGGEVGEEMLDRRACSRLWVPAMCGVM